MSVISEIGRQDRGLRQSSTAEQLYEALRHRILTLDLTPGMQLSRNDLASTYRVSQTPVRDALRLLEQEGLVVVYPQSRTEVARIDLDQARETQFLRVSLELEVVRALCEAEDRTGPDEAARILQMQRTALDIDDMARFSQLDRDFHRAMFRAAGVEALWQVVEARSGHINRLRNLNLLDPDKASTILAAHAQLLERLRARDITGAQAAVRDHLSGTLASADAIKAAHREFF